MRVLFLLHLAWQQATSRDLDLKITRNMIPPTLSSLQEMWDFDTISELPSKYSKTECVLVRTTNNCYAIVLRGHTVQIAHAQLLLKAQQQYMFVTKLTSHSEMS